MRSIKPGDPFRAAAVAAALLCAVLADPHAAIPLAIIVPPAAALRSLPIPRWSDGALCAALLCAQLGALAGFTESLVAWDLATHFLVGGLLGMALEGTGRVGPVAVVTAVAALAVGWEVAEAILDATAGTSLAPTHGDTATDLLAGVGGAALALTPGSGRLSPS